MTFSALVLVLVALTVLKLLRSFKADSLVLSSDIMNITADQPLTLLSFLVILALMAFCFGMPSALTRLCAKEVTSTPDPAPSDVIIFCALALLAAARSAAEVVLVVELTEEVAMAKFKLSNGNRLGQKKLEPIL